MYRVAEMLSCTHMPDVLAFLSSVGYAVPRDVVVLTALALVCVVYGLTTGRDRSIVPLLAMYVAYVLAQHLPLVPRLNHWLTLPPSPTLAVLWFGLFFLAGAFLFRRTPHIQPLGREAGTWWEAIFLAILQVGLAVSLVAHLLPANVVSEWTPRLRAVFVGEWGTTFWMLAPLLFLVFVRRPFGYSSDLTLS